MDVNIKAISILMLAGISIAWSPIGQPTAYDHRCSISQPVNATTKCPAYRYQYDRRTNLCQPVCCSSAPFSTFVECSQTCRSMEACFVHRPRSTCASRMVTVYYFNPAKGACLAEPGCTYIGNNFPTLGECQRTCRAKTTGPAQSVPGAPGNIFPSHPSNGRGPPFPQQIPQLPASTPVTSEQGGGRPSTNQQQGMQGQITPGTMPSHGQQQWNPNPPAPSLRQQPGTPTSSFPSQSNTGGPPPFPQQVPQIPQLPSSGPMTPQQNWGTLSSNHQQGAPGQISSGTTLPPAHQPSYPNPMGSTTSPQRPQQSWSGIFPPVNTETQAPGSGPQFPQQSGQQPWNGAGTSQQSSLNQSSHGIAQNNSPLQHGTGSLSVSDQRPGEQSWRGHMGSHIPHQSAHQQWGNGVVPPNSPQMPPQQSGSGAISTPPQSQWGNPTGSSYFPQSGQPQQRGSGNVPQNLQQHPSAQMTPSNSQQGPQCTWRSGAPAAGQPQSTAAHQANGAVQVPPTPSAQPPWGGQAATLSSQGLQQGQPQWRGGIPPGSQQNSVVQHTDGTNLRPPNQLTQPSLNGQPQSRPWKTRVTIVGSLPGTQQHETNGLISQLLTSLMNQSPSEMTGQSMHRRVVSIRQQTVQRSLRRQSVSTSR
uniref:Putative bilaris n=1 Tax=Rhipicephalus pulchellus TaxID=72859 RepID=L7LR36_RHIPC